MDVITFFIILGIFYSVALFFDMFFKSCMHYPYDAFLRNTGLTITFLRVNWYTTVFNRTIFKWGSALGKLLQQSFNLGILATLIILLPTVIVILLMQLFRSDGTSTTSDGSAKIVGPTIEILLPGVNLPLNEIGYYLAALTCTSIVHELGHALAAVTEDVPVIGFGMCIVFCFPIAYTSLSTDHMNVLKAGKKLRILCAGIWHNIIWAFFCFLIFTSLEYVFVPFYRVNHGMIITDVVKNSAIAGAKGLHYNDVIIGMNDCVIKNIDDWYDCLLKTIKEKPAYCVSSEFIRLNDETRPIVHGRDGVLQCCDPSNQKMICFEYIDDISNDDPLEIPQHMCLDIRKTVEATTSLCKNACEEGFCIRPLLNNATTIMTIKREMKEFVLYMGHPLDITQNVKVSEFIPKTNLLGSTFADIVSVFLKYNIVFSFGLALVNAIPCYGLDGHHIANTLIHSLLASKIPERGKRDLVVLAVNIFGTSLFICALLRVIWSSFFAQFF